jgi:hypothetical protein
MRAVVFAAGFFLSLSGCDGAGPWSGPYGTDGGLSLKQLSKFSDLRQVSGRMYMGAGAPDNSSKADSYTYLIGESSGLCGVSGHFSDLRNHPDNYPDRLIEKFGLDHASERAPEKIAWQKSDASLGSRVETVEISYTDKDGKQDAEVFYYFDRMASCH